MKKRKDGTYSFEEAKAIVFRKLKESALQLQKELKEIKRSNKKVVKIGVYV